MLLVAGTTALTLASPQVVAGISPSLGAPVALVAGNSDYAHVMDDPSGSEDTESVARSLAGLGFEVIKGVDLDRSEFVASVVDFHNRSRGRGAALFFYSGHATHGRSFNKGRVMDALLPVDTPDAANFVDYGVDIDDILATMESGVNLMFLDAAASDRPRIQRLNTLIAYADSSPASTPDGGVFTNALLTALAPGIDVVDMVQLVIRSSGEQQPWTESSLRRPYRLPSPGPSLADKLDVRLLELVEKFEAGGLAATAAHGAANSGNVEGGDVAVRIIAASEDDVDGVGRLIEASGGEMRTSFENNIYATLPLAAVVTFARAGSVFRMDLDQAVVLAPEREARMVARDEPGPVPTHRDDSE